MIQPAKISFQKKEDQFYLALNRRVRAYFKANKISTFANHIFWIKGGGMVAVYLLAYSCLLLWGNFLAVLLSGYMVMGAMAILIGLNIGHDAAHGSVSANSFVNRSLRLVFDLLGANSYMWRNRHVFAHHPYPNIQEQDSDIQQVPFVRIFPNSVIGAIHRFQHIYMPFVYLLYTLHWLYRRDFIDFFSGNIGAFRQKEFHLGEFLKMLVFKAIYLFYVLIVPVLILDHPWWVFLLGILLMNFSASGVVAIALVSAHVGEDAVFPDPDEQGIMTHTWAEHQIITTSDFATRNPVVNFLFGGFNHHVIHHLFPRICHVHYPYLTPLIEETAREFGLIYNCEPRLGRAILSHWRLLKNRGPNAWHEMNFEI